MKGKHTYMLVLLAAVLCASCQGMQPEVSCGMQEMAFSFSDPSTKGLVTGTSLVDETAGNRPLVVSAYLNGASGDGQDYFVGETFSASGGAWRRDPAVYWPAGAVMDILAYSATSPFDAQDVSWDPVSCAASVTLTFDASRSQDDVLFGAAYHATASSTDASGRSALAMSHCQAWIDVRLSLAAGNARDVRVLSVSLRDIYAGGDLTVRNHAGTPELSWSFRRFAASDQIVDDLSGVYGTRLTTAEHSVGMLIPQQEMRSIAVRYTVDGAEKTSVRTLPQRYWIAGERYIYSFIFNPGE